MKGFIFIFLAIFVFAVSVAEDLPVNFMFTNHEFAMQRGRISLLRFNTKPMIKKSKSEDSIPQNLGFHAGFMVTGSVTLNEIKLKDVKSIDFQWDSSDPNPKPLTLNQLMVGGYENGQQFCYKEKIYADQAVTLTSCTVGLLDIIG